MAAAPATRTAPATATLIWLPCTPRNTLTRPATHRSHTPGRSRTYPLAGLMAAAYAMRRHAQLHIDIDLHRLPRDCDACLQHTATGDMQMALNARHAKAPRATQRMHLHNTTLNYCTCHC